MPAATRPLLLFVVALCARPVFSDIPHHKSAAEAEVARIRFHILGAERLIAQSNVSGLSVAQKQARQHNLYLLRAYRLRGVFPQNEHFPHQRVPVFRDDHGTLCAMGYLIAKSGRMDLVNRIAQTQNYARIPDLAHDPALVAWLRKAGINALEATRIQPTYEIQRNQEEHDLKVARRQGTVAGVGSGIAIWANTRPMRSGSQRTSTGIFGLAMGVYSFKVAKDSLDTSNSSERNLIGLGSGALSVVDLYLGLRTLFSSSGRKSKPAFGRTNVPNGSDTSLLYDGKLHIAPVMLPRGGGLVLSQRF